MRIDSRARADVMDAAGVLGWLGWAPAERATPIAGPAAVPVAPAGERSLSRLVPGERETVCRVAGSGPIRQRLLELGVTPGAVVEVVRYAPLGDPMEVCVRGYHLSLRRREAAAIWVRWEDRERDGDDTPDTAPRRGGGQSEQR